jgi:hypothetical protein
LIDYTSRLFRRDKARVSRELAPIFDRLGTTAESWQARMRKLFVKTRLLGSYFSSDQERLRDLARKRGVHHLDNLASVTA